MFRKWQVAFPIIENSEHNVCAQYYSAQSLMMVTGRESAWFVDSGVDDCRPNEGSVVFMDVLEEDVDERETK